MDTYKVRANGGHKIHVKERSAEASLCGHNPYASDNCWMMKRRGKWLVLHDQGVGVTCKKCAALANALKPARLIGDGS
jgi:hypothetical protein